MSWGRRINNKYGQVWLPIALVEKIKDENAKANRGSPYYRDETTQDTYERILEKFFEAPKAKGKKNK